MIFDQILHELRTTNDLLRLLMATRDPHSTESPIPPEVEIQTTLFGEELANLLAATCPAAPTGWHKVPTLNGSRPWTDTDRDRLRVLFELGFTDDEIGDRLGRSPDGIRARRSRDRLITKGVRHV